MNKKRNAEMQHDVDKMIRIIRSCKTKEQFDGAQKMVDLFGKKWLHTPTDGEFERLVAYNRFTLFGFNLGRQDALLKEL